MTKLKVLMIDDEVDYCQIMKNFFTKRNYEVYLAYTLNDGLNLLNSVRPDILFLDNNLPDGLGWDFVEEIRQKLPQIEINLISAYSHGDVSVSNLPGIYVWEKPLQMDQLNKFFS